VLQIRTFYIDNTNIDEPFLAYDGDPVNDIYVLFIKPPSSLNGNFKNLKGYYHVTNNGTKLSSVSGLFRENGTANMHYNGNIVIHNLGALILYEHQRKRRVYVKINWNGSFFDQWKRIALYDELDN
jgi:hypothetical protein